MTPITGVPWDDLARHMMSAHLGCIRQNSAAAD
jgi:hypothetical protein